MNYPTSKKDVIQHTQQNKGKVDDVDNVINTLNRIPEKDYQSMADIEHEFGQVK